MKQNARQMFFKIACLLFVSKESPSVVYILISRDMRAFSAQIHFSVEADLFAKWTSSDLFKHVITRRGE